MERVEVDRHGLLGDRAYALIDVKTGRVASAKHPRKWGALLECHARFVEPPRRGAGVPDVELILPGGKSVRSSHEMVSTVLSDYLGREVVIQCGRVSEPRLEMDWPDIDGLYRPKNTVTEEGIPGEGFFDVTPVHLLTTSSLRELSRMSPESNLDLRRFRPNILVETPDDGFVEATWVGREIAIGSEVRLRVAMQSPRCVMTTVAQEDLPRDLGVLRALAHGNESNFGIYAEVIVPGEIQVMDRVRVLD